MAAGMAVNPVQALARMAQVDGQEVQVRFQTVRFAQQPVSGLRMYFCQHLTPDYVWLPKLMQHPNGVNRMVRITMRSPNAMQTAQTLACVADAPYEGSGPDWEVVLENLRLHIVHDPQAERTTLSRLILQRADGSEQALDTGV